MPLVPFDSLNDDSRVWVFAAEPPLDEDRSKLLLEVVDDFLRQWVAHGEPLTSGREWRDRRFLIVGVDQSATAYASGCSIDGLYRKLAEFEKQTGASLLSRDRVFYRDAGGEVRSVSRDEFAQLSTSGVIGHDTIVYDTSISSLGEWRQRFELPASASWHRALLAV
jgi:hypothetical protein